MLLFLVDKVINIVKFNFIIGFFHYFDFLPLSHLAALGDTMKHISLYAFVHHTQSYLMIKLIDT